MDLYYKPRRGPGHVSDVFLEGKCLGSVEKAAPRTRWVAKNSAGEPLISCGRHVWKSRHEAGEALLYEHNKGAR